MKPILVLALLAGVMLVIILLQARWAASADAADEEPDEPDDDDRVRHHLDRLGAADPAAVREATNRLLALGPRVIPALCDHLRSLDDAAEAAARSRQGLIEEVVASFGLRAVAPLAHSLRRVVFPSPMVAAALRIARRVGEAALPAFLAALDEENCAALGLILHRCPGLPVPHLVRAGPTLSPGRLRLLLQVFGGALEHYPEAGPQLWTTCPPAARRVLVAFYVGWPSPSAKRSAATKISSARSNST